MNHAEANTRFYYKIRGSQSQFAFSTDQSVISAVKEQLPLSHWTNDGSNKIPAKMKVFVVVLSAVLLASVALAHPHHHHPHHHSSPEDSSDSDSHDSSDCGKPKPPVRPELQEYLNDLRDFVALYPIDEIKQIIGEHLEDPELQATIAFLQSDEFEDLAEQIVESPEVQAVLQYLKDADWPWAKKMLKAALQQRRALRNGNFLMKRS